MTDQNEGELEKTVKGNERFIIAEMGRDPFSSRKIPIVVESSHKRFTKGYRFDYGFLNLSIEEGYTVLIRSPDSKGKVIVDLLDLTNPDNAFAKKEHMRTRQSEYYGSVRESDLHSAEEFADDALVRGAINSGYSVMFRQPGE